MSHVLEFIGNDNNIYVNSPNGSQVSNAKKQVLSIGNTIDNAIMASNISVAEQTGNLQRHVVTTHQYYKWDAENETLIIDNGVVAEKIPQYLNGWETQNGQAAPSGVLTQQMVEAYFDSSHNMNLYGVWEDVRLIRVIIYVPSNSSTLDVRYDVLLTANNSYSTSNIYCLTSNYKDIRDNGSNLNFVINGNPIKEFGNGYGCPINNVVRYFGIKSGDTATLSISPSQSFGNGYVPYYTFDEHLNVVYECSVVDGLLRYGAKDGYIPERKQTMTYTNGVWFINLGNITTDKTILIPLQYKPLVVASVSPSGAGTTQGGGYFLPGSTCTLTAAQNAGYVFSEWQLNGTQVSTSQTYSFTVENSTELTAVFRLQSGSVFYFSWLTSEGADDISQHVKISVNGAQQQYVSKQPMEFQVSSSSVIVITMDTRFSISGTQYEYESVRSYTSNARRDPDVDRGLSPNGGTLSNGVSYMFYGGSMDEKIFRLDFSGIDGDVSLSLYAYFLQN